MVFFINNSTKLRLDCDKLAENKENEVTDNFPAWSKLDSDLGPPAVDTVGSWFSRRDFFGRSTSNPVCNRQPQDEQNSNTAFHPFFMTFEQ